MVYIVKAYEQTLSRKDIIMSEQEEVTSTEEVTHEFNKELQQEQQKRANVERRAEVLATELAEANQRLDSIPETPTEEIDTYSQVGATVEKVRELEQQLVNANASIQSINEKTAFNETLDEFDRLYGAKNRNGALNRARQRCADAGISLIGDDRPAFNDLVAVIRESYIHEDYQGQLKAQANLKTVPQGDSGYGGNSLVSLGDDIKAGTMEEVVAQMRARPN